MKIDFQKVDVSSAIAIVQEAVRAASKEPNPKEAIEEAIRRVAAGRDGQLGTADDLIPPATIDNLVMLLNTGMLNELINVWLPAQKWTCCLSRCF